MSLLRAPVHQQDKNLAILSLVQVVKTMPNIRRIELSNFIENQNLYLKSNKTKLKSQIKICNQAASADLRLHKVLDKYSKASPHTNQAALISSLELVA